VVSEEGMTVFCRRVVGHVRVVQMKEHEARVIERERFDFAWCGRVADDLNDAPIFELGTCPFHPRRIFVSLQIRQESKKSPFTCSMSGRHC
jgi:hypothetical protein